LGDHSLIRTIPLRGPLVRARVGRFIRLNALRLRTAANRNAR